MMNPDEIPSLQPRRQALKVVSKLASKLALGGLLGSALGLEQAWADSEANLKLVITFPPGGSTDIAARMLQPRLAEKTGRAVVVENRPGAASQIATQYVAKSAPDGNTLLVCFDTHAINPIAKPRLPYDTFKDFVGISLAVRFPLVIAASSSVQANDLRGFVQAAKAAPGKYSYASTGLGSMNHLVMEDIKRQAGIFVVHVPFGGGGPAVQAVLSDVTQLTLLSYAALRGQIQAGKVKALAVTGKQRLPELPQVPTVAESGFPHFEAHSWIGVLAPAATPAETVRKLTREFQASLLAPDVHQKLTQAGFEVMATDGPTLDRHVRAEYERWGRFVRENRLSLDE